MKPLFMLSNPPHIGVVCGLDFAPGNSIVKLADHLGNNASHHLGVFYRISMSLKFICRWNEYTIDARDISHWVYDTERQVFIFFGPHTVVRSENVSDAI